MRHKWEETAKGHKCKTCQMKLTHKKVRSTHHAAIGGYVTRIFYQPKGGDAVQSDKTPPCPGVVDPLGVRKGR